MPAGADDIGFLALWQIVYRYKLSILAFALLTVMMTTLVVYSMTPVYRAQAKLLIERAARDTGSLDKANGTEPMANEYLKTQFELIKSRTMAERVVRELKLTQQPEFDPRQRPHSFSWRDLFAIPLIQRFLPVTRPADLLAPEAPTEDAIFEDVVSALMNRVSIAPLRGTQMVEISVDMTDPVLSAKAANALAKGYIDSQFEARLGINQTMADWMTNRLSELKVNLQVSEERLQQFREKEHLIDLEGVTTLSGQELSQTDARMVESRREMALTENQYLQIKGLMKAGWEALLTAPVIRSDPLVQQHRADESRARAKVEELSKRYGHKHPSLTAARTELDSAVTSLRAQVDQVASSIERNYQLALANDTTLRGTLEQKKEGIQELKRKEFKFREIQRDVETNRALYDTFMTRLKETTAVADLNAANARIVDAAKVPNEPARPLKGRIVGFAGLLALLAGIALALLREKLDNRVRDPNTAEEKLRLPILGLVPLKKSIDSTRIARMYLDNLDMGFSESIRSIRTGVLLSGLDNPHKIIVVTSALPGEGKTSLASNLSFALGQMEKILLIEGDMRLPKFQRLFDLPADAPGLADVMAGTAQLDDALHQVGTIEILGCGTPPPNPLEMLSTKRFAQLLEELADRYDRIIIDSPPVQLVSDALVLASYSSTVIFVVKVDATPIPVITKCIAQFQNNKAPLAGVVLNQMPLRKRGRYGYSNYGYYQGGGNYYAAH